MNKFETEIQGKKVLVFGLGRQGGGTGDADWLTQHGAIVRISDRDLSLCSEGQTKEQIDWADLIIKNPAVPDDHDLIVYAKSKCLPVLTSIAIFVKYSPITTIAVTGTRGKSTTVGLIGAVLESCYPGQIISGGNIAGTSCLSLFDQTEGKQYAVLELSSFQLHNFHDLKVSPNIAVVTNLYPDHLNRYDSMVEYQKDKEAICQYQSQAELCFFNQDNHGSISISRVSSASKIAFSKSDVAGWEVMIPGSHNLENVAAVWSLASSLGIDEKVVRQSVAKFAGVPFRQQKIATINGISYINDTTATTPIAALKALQASSTPTIWITGGDTKNLPFDELLAEVKSNIWLKKIVILGSANIPLYTQSLQQIAGDKIVGTAASMVEALILARSVALPGDNILLSPGFASFDLFQNEFDRGRQFNELVESYAKN